MDPWMYILDTLAYMGIFAILTLSLNLEYGFTGLGNFGKVAFFMAGAYVYALTVQTGIPFYFCLAFSAMGASILGALVSLPALRLREDYLAIVTLTFGEILRIVVKAEQGLTGGVWGITVPSAFSGWGLPIRTTVLANVLLIFTIVALVFVFLHLLVNTPYGRVLRSIREDDLAVSSLGKNVVAYKVQVFMIGSAIAGVAGGLFAQYMRFIDPTMFLPLVTFFVWIMLILGGPANHWGALIGALLVEFLNRGTRMVKDYVFLPVDPNNLQFILFGVLIILLIMYRPYGLLREKPLRTAAQKKVL
jgi:branched-chain amino acid transport system permease protein